MRLSAAHKDEEGWSVEVRIPYNQLRFKKRDEYIWGINFIRLIKRKNEKDFFSWTPKEGSGYVSRFAVLRGIHDINPVAAVRALPFCCGKGSIWSWGARK